MSSGLKDMIRAVEDSVFKVLNELQDGSITIECLQKLKGIKNSYYDSLFTFQVNCNVLIVRFTLEKGIKRQFPFLQRTVNFQLLPLLPSHR